MITVEDCLKALARKKQKKRFTHKTSYGREMKETFGYDVKAHEEHYQRIKNTPYDMQRWEQ